MVACITTVAFQGIKAVPGRHATADGAQQAGLQHCWLARQGGRREPRAGAGRAARLRLVLPPKRITINLAPAPIGGLSRWLSSPSPLPGRVRA